MELERGRFSWGDSISTLQGLGVTPQLLADASTTQPSQKNINNKDDNQSKAPGPLPLHVHPNLLDILLPETSILTAILRLIVTYGSPTSLGPVIQLL
jgi:hypothetical protein